MHTTILLKKDKIDKLERKYRLNLINSITGVKPANLIGTRSLSKQDNLAIFSSVVHLGSHPAQIGFVMRPQSTELKDTFANITSTGFYTINHVSSSFIKKAHYTSAKLPKERSEFDVMGLKRELVEDFWAPFVKESAVKIGMKHLESIPLPNGCLFIIGEVEMIILPQETINTKGQLNLEGYNAVGISGLNTYYSLKKAANYPYVRLNELPDFE